MNERVLAIMGRIAKVDPQTLKPEMELTAELGFDSPKALQLICDLEDELKIEIPEDAVERITTVGDVLALIPKSKNNG